tara:strand:+ start:63605 stop:64744 length:1140 start_codon:yes stop_codon:yes gene_type:complete
MIKWFSKYGIVILLFNTILMSIKETRYFADQLFLIIMFLFSFLIILNPKQVKYVILHKSFLFLTIINCINFIYFIIIHNINDVEAIKYLLARTVQFSIICISIYYNYEYYKERFFRLLINVIFFIVIISLILDPFFISGRYSGVIWNPNMLSSLVMFGFAFLFFKNSNSKDFWYYLKLFLLLLIGFSSGSRSSIVAIVIAFLVKYGFSKRNIFYSSLVLLILLVFSLISYESSIDRFLSQGLFSDRIIQWQFALESVKNKFFLGYGLDKYAFIDDSLVSESIKDRLVGAHNGYLAILTQYGFFIGSFVVFIIIRKSLDLIIFFNKYKGFQRVYLYVIIFTLIASIYETMFTGINEFNTILFWFSLSMLSYSKYKDSNEV